MTRPILSASSALIFAQVNRSSLAFPSPTTPEVSEIRLYLSNSQTYLGECESGVLCRNTDIAGKSNFHTAAQAVSVDGSDYRCSELMNFLKDSTSEFRIVACFIETEFAHLFDVSAGNECLLSGSFYDYTVDVFVFFHFVKCCSQIGKHRLYLLHSISSEN